MPEAPDRAAFAIAIGGNTTVTASTVTISRPATMPRVKPDRTIVDAVYAHLQALRGLGRSKVAASEVATALGVSQAAVVQAMHALQKRGVKIL